jgi:ABC-type Fe3+/spermidine/putrescine transport system ATPase subunit
LSEDEKMPVITKYPAKVKIMVRPEDIDIVKTDSIMEAKIIEVNYKGLLYELICKNKNDEILKVESIDKHVIGNNIKLK